VLYPEVKICSMVQGMPKLWSWRSWWARDSVELLVMKIILFPVQVSLLDVSMKGIEEVNLTYQHFEGIGLLRLHLG
jgi:hypothetical protein